MVDWHTLHASLEGRNKSRKARARAVSATEIKRRRDMCGLGAVPVGWVKSVFVFEEVGKTSRQLVRVGAAN